MYLVWQPTAADLSKMVHFFGPDLTKTRAQTYLCAPCTNC